MLSVTTLIVPTKYYQLSWVLAPLSSANDFLCFMIVMVFVNRVKVTCQ